MNLFLDVGNEYMMGVDIQTKRNDLCNTIRNQVILTRSNTSEEEILQIDLCRHLTLHP